MKKISVIAFGALLLFCVSNLSAMNLKITPVDVAVDKKMLEKIEVKANKLVKYYENIIGAEITLRIEKTNAPENKVVNMKVTIPGKEFFVKKNAKTFEEAVDGAVELMRNEITKYKEKVRSK